MKISKGLFLYTFLALNIIIGLILPQTSLADPITRHVPKDYATIQAAIDAASSGDTVSVAAGMYSLDRAITMKNGVGLIGAGADVCTLVGAAGSAVIECQNITNTNTIIEGFTIKHYVTNPVTFGSGIRCYNNSSPTIRNNIITGNTDKKGGGGISCEGPSSPTIINNIIEVNNAYSFQDYLWQGGGGILCYNSSPTIANNDITGNSAYYVIGTNSNFYIYNAFNDVGGGGILCYGSGSSQTKIIGNTITDNSTGSRGGGISCYQSSPTIVNNVMGRNSAGFYGGGISCENSSPTITNNTIIKNTAYTYYSGGGIFCWNSSSHIANNIITNNNAPAGDKAGGIYSNSSTSLTISYNDVFGNTSYNYVNCGSVPLDISSDPLFVNPNPIDPKTADYHLQQGSPCIDKGDNYAQGLEGITLDLDGKPRIVKGSDIGLFVDMGAYEYSITITPSAGPGGAISPSEVVIVNYGDSCDFTITPDPGYRIAHIKVDDLSVEPISPYTFNNVTASHTIEVIFVRTCTISGTVTAGGVGLAGVVMSGLFGSPSTDSNGQYSGTVDFGWSGTVTPIKAGYTFTPSSQDYSHVTSDQTTNYIYEIKTYNLSINEMGTGTGLVAETVEGVPSSGPYAHGTVVTLTAKPAENSEFAGWSGDLSGMGNPAMITMNSGKSVTATFSLKQYTIEASAGDGGTISPSGSVSVNHGDSITFKISPAEGYYITDVIVDGKSVGAVACYTFNNVASNHSISAVFAANTCEIIAIAGEGGIITPAGKVTVNYGGSQTFVIVPHDGYHVSNVRVDGKSVGALRSYTFTNIKANHRIKAIFAPDVIRADVVIHPDTLNLKNEDDEDTITAYINLPRRYDEVNIDVATVKLDVLGKMVPALMPHTWKNDHHYHKSPGRVVRFSLKAVIAALNGRTGHIIMTVSGQLKDGTRFSGSDKVKVIDQGKKNRRP